MRLTVSGIKKLLTSKWHLTISTYFTLLRLVLVPFIVISMIKQQWGLAFWFFVVAALSDVIDGRLARMLDQRSFLGACLDPIADKVLILSCFFTLAFIETPLFVLPRPFVFFVLIKETLQIVGALLLFAIRGFIYIRPMAIGKMTTLVQVSFIIWLFACYFFHWMPVKTYAFMIGLMVILVALSFIQYVYIGYKYMVGNYELYS